MSMTLNTTLSDVNMDMLLHRHQSEEIQPFEFKVKNNVPHDNLSCSCTAVFFSCRGKARVI
jgi:hypothetical protein